MLGDFTSLSEARQIVAAGEITPEATSAALFVTELSHLTPLRRADALPGAVVAATVAVSPAGIAVAAIAALAVWGTIEMITYTPAVVAALRGANPTAQAKWRHGDGRGAAVITAAVWLAMLAVAAVACVALPALAHIGAVVVAVARGRRWWANRRTLAAAERLVAGAESEPWFGDVVAARNALAEEAYTTAA